MIDWFCWISILAGLALMASSRYLHRRTGVSTAVWLIIGAIILAFGLWRLDF